MPLLLLLPLPLVKDQNSGISIKLEFVIAAAQQAAAQDWLSGMRRLIKMQPEGGERGEPSELSESRKRLRKRTTRRQLLNYSNASAHDAFLVC